MHVEITRIDMIGDSRNVESRLMTGRRAGRFPECRT